MAKDCLLGFLLAFAWVPMCICQVDWRTTADFHSSSPSLTTSGGFNIDQKTSWRQEGFLHNRQHDGRRRPPPPPPGPNFLPSWTISSSSQLASKSDTPEPRGVKAEIDHRRHQRIGQSDPTSWMTRSPGPKSNFFSHLLPGVEDDLSTAERDHDNRNTTTGHTADNSNPHSAIVELNNSWNKSESIWTQSEAVLATSPSSNDDKRTRDEYIVKCRRDEDQGQASVIMMEQEAVQLPTSFLRILSQLTDSPLVSNLFQLIVKSALGDFIQTDDDDDDAGMTHTIKTESSHNHNRLETLQDFQVVVASQIQKIFIEQLSQIISSWLDPLLHIPSTTTTDDDDDQVVSIDSEEEEDTLSESLENLNKIQRVENSMSPRGWTVLGPGPTKAVIAAGILIALAVYGRTWRYVIPNEYALEAITVPPELYPNTEAQHPLPTPGRRSLSSITTQEESAMMIFDTAIPRPNLDKENVDEDLYGIDRASSAKSEYRSKPDESSSSALSLPNLTYAGVLLVQ